MDIQGDSSQVRILVIFVVDLERMNTIFVVIVSFLPMSESESYSKRKHTIFSASIFWCRGLIATAKAVELYAF